MIARYVGAWRERVVKENPYIPSFLKFLQLGVRPQVFPLSGQAGLDRASFVHKATTTYGYDTTIHTEYERVWAPRIQRELSRG